MSGGKISTNFAQAILSRSYTDDATYSIPSVFKVGVGTTDATASDSDLETAVPISGTETVDSCDATTNWSDSADMTVSVNSTTYKEGGKSLNLTKDAGTAATASTSKTTTSVDGTSKDFHLWLYIKDATAYAKLAVSNALEIRFGSDSAKYYKYQADKADLAVGWNLIKLAIPGGFDSTVGVPLIAALDYTYISLTADAAATVWSAGDFIMDDIKVASAGDYTKVYETGYPSINTSTLEVTHRVALLSTEANGYLISEAGFFNTDTSPLIISRDTFTNISKSSTDEVIIVSKDKLSINT